MINWNMNGEGYTDRTAGTAMRNISREERKNAMAKKRSCRRTAYENAVHEKAVKIRKMTDKQLVQYVKDCENEAWNKGFSSGKKESVGIDLDEIIEEIGSIKGIGIVKMKEIRQIIKEGIGA